MEILVACVLAYWLMRHGPQLVAEALAEADYTHRGELSPRAQARLRRLTDAGIDPAVGGPARQFLGNAWRDAWLDLDAARARRRAASTGSTRPAGSPGSAGGWFRARFDAAVDTAAERWRSRRDERDIPDDHPDDPGDLGDDRPVPGDEPLDDPDSRTYSSEFDELDDEPPIRIYPNADPDDPGEPPVEEPVRDAPHTTTQPATEGTTTMAGTAVVHVTGVTSAAHEARNISNQISAVTEAYQKAMEDILVRALKLGQSTVGEIQQAMTSDTVAAIATACEAIAAAAAGANRAASEAAPAMSRVARAFDRIV